MITIRRLSQSSICRAQCSRRKTINNWFQIHKTHHLGDLIFHLLTQSIRESQKNVMYFWRESSNFRLPTGCLATVHFPHMTLHRTAYWSSLWFLAQLNLNEMQPFFKKKRKENKATSERLAGNTLTKLSWLLGIIRREKFFFGISRCILLLGLCDFSHQSSFLFGPSRGR